MITIKVNAQPIVTVSGLNYSASVTVSAFNYANDNEQWKIAETVLVIGGPTSDSVAMTRSKLKTAADAWRIELASLEIVTPKLANLVGLET